MSHMQPQVRPTGKHGHLHTPWRQVCHAHSAPRHHHQLCRQQQQRRRVLPTQPPAQLCWHSSGTNHPGKQACRGLRLHPPQQCHLPPEETCQPPFQQCITLPHCQAGPDTSVLTDPGMHLDLRMLHLPTRLAYQSWHFEPHPPNPPPPRSSTTQPDATKNRDPTCIRVAGVLLR